MNPGVNFPRFGVISIFIKKKKSLSSGKQSMKHCQPHQCPTMSSSYLLLTMTRKGYYKFVPSWVFLLEVSKQLKRFRISKVTTPHDSTLALFKLCFPFTNTNKGINSFFKLLNRCLLNICYYMSLNQLQTV